VLQLVNLQTQFTCVPGVAIGAANVVTSQYVVAMANMFPQFRSVLSRVQGVYRVVALASHLIVVGLLQCSVAVINSLMGIETP
jgi:hypothetical protein